MAIKIDEKILKYQKFVIFIPMILLSAIFLFAKFWIGMVSLLLLVSHFYLFCFLIPLYVFYYFFEHYFKVSKKIISKMALVLVIISYLNLFYKYGVFFYKYGMTASVLNKHSYNLMIFPFHSFIQIMEGLLVVFIAFSSYRLGLFGVNFLKNKVKKDTDKS